MLGKNTILKAIHNSNIAKRYSVEVWMVGKNTILKAIHNISDSIFKSCFGVNAG